MQKVRLSRIVTPHFQTFWKAANSRRYLRHVLKGGRGSAKSTHIGIRLITDMMRYPVTAVCIRRVANTLAESVFEQLKEAIEILGVGEYWRVVKNPLQLIYKPRGNKIIFRGADDANKIKSIKMAKFPIAIMWIEELAEFKTEDEVSTIENSVLRAELPDGLFYAFYYSYNPPKRKQSWVNKKYETQFVPVNTFVHHSTYLDNPHISKAFVEEAEDVKAKSPQKYEWEYLGKAIGSGVVPFDNLVFRRITDEEIKRFDNIRQGVDWGYGVDPFAFVRWHYDKTRRKIYALDEIYAVKLSNREAAEQIKAKGYDTQQSIADSAEPKSVDELKLQYHIRIKGARKGPGSVEYGEKWLDDLEEIVIDPQRTPNIAREFENIDYQTDADGNPKAKLEDKDNHTIDATRYAFENDMKRSGISFD
ncbi:PBSX family phage terminase large subunit [Heliophilum fasciatum]|uniref:PBSX family phage terminase large subunit n=1 Tax=Heliophilum fasciatum TaxID=35700 RepID=A0A4R2RXP5_9FIRM|nr:PBSX family phage terminase large subunit [Heliophilum fasciatum]MCW2277744.1 PBSX family phage terminase large subunit [Heliophilum fasciatum]TCP64761.1 PBSX family phage terminase large subunit [Heliophilum fasciatum]